MVLSHTSSRRISETLLHRDPDSEFEGNYSAFVTFLQLSLSAVHVERMQADEEELLNAIPPNSQEAIVSCLSLHWVNDLPG